SPANGDPDFNSSSGPSTSPDDWIPFYNYSSYRLFGSSGSGGGASQIVGTPPKQQIQPANTAACGNLPAGTSPALCKALQQGLQNALNALKRKSCSNFYGGQGPQMLNQTQYRFLPNAPTVGAWTILPDQGQSVSTNVFINSQGPFITFAPTIGERGPFGRYWTTQAQFRGFILLHELGHQLSEITGFRPDPGPQNLN